MFSEKRQGFGSYSKHLRDQKIKELEQIKRIKIKGKVKVSNDSFMRVGSQKHVSNISCCASKSNTRDRQVNDKQGWIRIDQKAVIVNGKLVYIEDERLSVRQNDELICLLNQNGVRVKDYIYGNKKELLEEIENNYERKKDEEIEKYINKNMKEENSVKADCSDWYVENKISLFGSD